MNTVYKYRSNIFDSIKGFRQDTKSLLEGEFYAAKFKHLNDPFEGSVELPKSYEDEHWVTPIIQEINSVGIYSLVKPKTGELYPSNELMWAHYADSHKGFCIEYDLEKLKGISSKTCSNDLINQINVYYTDESPKIEIEDNSFEIHTKAFGTKTKSWSSENELRLVYRTNGIKPIAENSITSIYFGVNMGFDERIAIIDGLRDVDITFNQMIKIDNSYNLESVNIDFNYEYEVVSRRPNSIAENYTILYKSKNKDRNSLICFLKHLRKDFKRPANFTIIDNIIVDNILNDGKRNGSRTEKEILDLHEHWLAYSSYDAPNDLMMYPER